MRSGTSAFRVRVEGPGSRGADMVLARAFQLPLEAARQLLAEPRVLPRDLGEEEARALAEALRQHGVDCEPVPVVGQSRAVCGAHPGLASELPCEDCRELVCVLCRGSEGRALCARCAALRARRARAKWVRVSVLLGVLVAIALWGLSRHRTRERRLEWNRPLQVAVVLLARGEVSAPVREAWREGLARLEDWAGREAERYRADPGSPIHFVLAGPVEPERQPLYPQPAAEVMVGEVPLGEAEGRLAESLDEVRVGPVTAKALRWRE
ncbi:B-box zinc finger protein [Melittangium boletus]|uniref:Uncharacterized protein n=1 Tax=Melittangium boletus DSM 14713 TaxID=1294270 RepID=A0A250IE69_9BACT|nr:B-box zinc finger protein [Melittangium boletus]ATB29427.1 hypothetical protein MEBOL_002876 [Melittangium boletus DSM 14713]